MLSASDFIKLLFFSSLTGEVSYFCWKKIGKNLVKYGYVQTAYHMLWGVIASYLLPVLYYLIVYLDRKKYLFNGYFWCNDSPAIYTVCVSLLFLWGIGVIWYAGKYLQERWKSKTFFKDSVEATVHEQEIFLEVAKEMKIPTNGISLIENAKVSLAAQTGMLRKQIILSGKKFSDEHLRVLLLHELIHCVHWDILMRRLARWVRILFFYLEGARRLPLQIAEWSEYACDDKACKLYGDTQAYFKNISETLDVIPDYTNEVGIGISSGYEELRKRLLFKKRVGIPSTKGKVIAFAIAFAISCLGGTTVVVASDIGIQAFLEIWRRTDIAIEEINEMPYMKEYEDQGAEKNVMEVFGPSDEVMSETGDTLTWYVPSGVACYSGNLYLTNGQHVVLGYSISPSNVSVKIGLRNSGGTRRYIYGNGTSTYDFTIISSGTYQIFVENTSGTDINASILYMIGTEE